MTGSGGFIGSHLATKLLDIDCNLIVLMKELDKNSFFSINNLEKKVKMYYGDLREFDEMERIMRREKIDTVFHLGAQSQVLRALEDPRSTLDINVRGTWNILEACRKNENVKRIVVASSDKAYGIHKKLPYTEEFQLNASYPYDSSKTCTDIIAQMYAKTYGLPIGITRCANIYGPGDINWDRLIPSTIKSLINKEEIVIRSDGTPERDYIYIDDAVNAYITLAKNIENVKGEAFNFGSGKPVNVLNVVNTLIEISGYDIKPKILGKSKGEIDRQYLDSTKAFEKLNWKAETILKDGLTKTYRWYKKIQQL